MKRQALLFGNSDGLAGVKLDLNNFSKFLVSDYGGCWMASEINVLMNPTRQELLSTIDLMKVGRPDYVFLVYSGHGGYAKGNVLEINSRGERVNESELRNIAKRQLLIYDCCRNVIQQPISEYRAFAKAESLPDSRQHLRLLWEGRIMMAIEQQASLYACSVGESSYDTNEGGIYSNCFLDSINPGVEKYKLVSIAQDQARPKTTRKAREVYSAIQTPDQSLPKCMREQELIISINPNAGSIWF